MFGLLVVSKLSQKSRTAKGELKVNKPSYLDKPFRLSEGGGSGELLLQQLVATGLGQRLPLSTHGVQTAVYVKDFSGGFWEPVRE
jgi:hypothetical protein